MSLPVSIGDAILLANIAYSLGQAFTSGRKSAPAEFADVQNLLYTLSNALKLVAQDGPSTVLTRRSSQGPGNGQDQNGEDENAVILQSVANCRVTLEHLQLLVTKYMDLDPKSIGDNPKKWKDEIKRNWKKIVWTREGAGLDKLKITLTAHINGLNLAMTAYNK
jgi:hypothetical protein